MIAGQFRDIESVPFQPNTTEATEFNLLAAIGDSLRKSNVVYAVVEMIFIPFIVTGNVLVVLSICVFRCFHNLSNVLLISLAFSDFLVATVTIPLYSMFYLFPDHLMFSRLACLSWFGSVILGCGSSLFNMLVIVLDRFFSIHFPFKYSTFKTTRNVVSVLVILWSYVVILSNLPLLGWHHWSSDVPCSFYSTLPQGYVIMAAYFTVGLCILISLLLYVAIFRKVKEHRLQIDSQISAGQGRWMVSQVRSTRLTVTVFLLFVLFWLPYFCVGPLKYSPLSQTEVDIIKNGCLVLAFSNSMVNPVVYGLMRHKFRVAYRLLLTTPPCYWYEISSKCSSDW